MKKFFVILFAAVVAASCTEGTYSSQYVVLTTFDYNIDYGTEFGADSTYFDSQNKVGIGWGDLAFMHKVGDDGSFKGGFLLSLLKPSGLAERPEDYVATPCRAVGNVVPGKEKNVYAVFSQTSEMPEHDIAFMQTTYGTCTVSHCFVNNTEVVYEAVKKHFKPGDELKIVATGYKGASVTKKAEIKLAADTTMYNWTFFDLKELGAVEHIDFDVISTNPNVPAEFCLDELQAKVSIEY